MYYMSHYCTTCTYSLLPPQAELELELLTCGEADVDVDALRAHVRYGAGVNNKQRHVKFLWQVVLLPVVRAYFTPFCSQVFEGCAPTSNLSVHRSLMASPRSSGGVSLSLSGVAHGCL